MTARAEAAEQALARAQEENSILRRAGTATGGGGAKGAGATIAMAFSLMDRIKVSHMRVNAHKSRSQ
jgi:hypothetical protein